MRLGVWTSLAAGACTALLLLGPFAVLVHQQYIYRPHSQLTSIVIGAVNTSHASFTVTGVRCSGVHVTVDEEPVATGQSMSGREILLSGESSWLVSLTVGGLDPARRVHSVSAVFAGCPGPHPSPSVAGSFSLVDPASSLVLGDPLEFVFGSCMARTALPPFNSISIFDGMRERHPAAEFALLLGDLAYLDLSAWVPWYRLDYDVGYGQTWSDPHLLDFVGSTPTFAMFDDHEIANDYDGGPADPLYLDAMAAFDRWIGDRNPEPAAPHTRYYTFAPTEGVSVFVVDTRSFRSAADAPDDANKTLLGEQQESLLKRWLLDEHAKGTVFKIIGSPVSWAHHGDGALFRTATQSLVAFVQAHNVTGVVVLSGDTHWAAAYQYGTEPPYVYECSASPFQALPFPDPAVLLGPTAAADPPGIHTEFVSSMKSHYGVARASVDDGMGVFECELYGHWPWWTGPTRLFHHMHTVALTA